MMLYRRLGDTELVCSMIGFGAYAIGGTDWHGTDEISSKKTLIAAKDNGVNFFDTSNAYGWGKSEELIGEVFHSCRKEIIIATKGGVITRSRDYAQKDFAPMHLSLSLNESLQRLKTEYVDLYQLHSPSAEDITDEVIDFMKKIIQEGKTRYVGVSISDEKSGLCALGVPIFRSLQVYFNMIEPSLLYSIFPVAKMSKVGLIGRVPLYSGFLSGQYSNESEFPLYDHRSHWPKELIDRILSKVARIKKIFVTEKYSLSQFALAFVIAHEDISVVIPGAKNVKQLRENVDSVNIKLKKEDIAAVYKIYAEKFD